SIAVLNLYRNLTEYFLAASVDLIVIEL
ncbi:MAG: hypothetical protein ACI9QV_001496, partial [Methylophagaceae bacterium]